MCFYEDILTINFDEGEALIIDSSEQNMFSLLLRGIRPHESRLIVNVTI